MTVLAFDPTTWMRPEDRVRRLLVAMLALALPTSALADVTAIYGGPNVPFSMKVQVSSNGDVRASTLAPGLPDLGLSSVTRDGQAYFVQQSRSGPEVIRLPDAALAMSEAMTQLPPEQRPAPFGAERHGRLIPKGEVTINGRTGTAYYDANAPEAAASEPVVVISDDPALAPLAKAWVRQADIWTSGMAVVFGSELTRADMRRVLETGAPIEMTGLQLQSVSTEDIPDSVFDLPAPPLSLDQVRERFRLRSPAKGSEVRSTDK